MVYHSVEFYQLLWLHLLLILFISRFQDDTLPLVHVLQQPVSRLLKSYKNSLFILPDIYQALKNKVDTLRNRRPLASFSKSSEVENEVPISEIFSGIKMLPFADYLLWFIY